jgi:lactase-phlorizin hydrolase
LPFSDSPEDVEAAEREHQFFLGWFGHPILKNGNYPQVMIDKVFSKNEITSDNADKISPRTC